MQRLRRSKLLLIAAAAVIGAACGGRSLVAQALPADIDGAAWNIDDPLNRAQVSTYLQLWSDGLVPGGDPAPADAYTFTNQLPSIFEAVCSRELTLFHTLYAHRLSDGPFASPGYGVWDLLHDDAEVRKQFIEYFSQHKLAMPLNGDPQALDKHLAAIQDAWFVGDKYNIFGDVTIEEQKLISQQLQVKDPPAEPTEPAPRTPDATPDTLKCFEFWLKQSKISATIMDCLVKAGVTGWKLYLLNPDLKFPDFDCDDFAYIEMAWLRKMLKDRFPDAEYQMYGYSRACPPDYKVTGHAVVLVRQSGYVWIVDPQTGQVVGPFKEPLSNDEIKRLIRQLMKDKYDNTCDHPWDENVWPFPPGKHPHEKYPKKENPPWQDDKDLPATDPRKSDPQKDMWERFKKKLAECCAALTPATPPEGCDPLFTPPAAAPDPCSPDSYVWPRS